jgi:hypothetical protein
MKKIKIIFGGIAAICAIAFLANLFVTTFSPDKDGPARMRVKYGCKPTNEFVGKEAERLWLCKDGLKHKEGVFYSWAYQEKREKRGW